MQKTKDSEAGEKTGSQIDRHTNGRRKIEKGKHQKEKVTYKKNRLSIMKE